MKKFVIILFVLILSISLVYFYLKRNDEKIIYETVLVSMGEIDVSVSASGIIVPINVVSVGTQVSGIIEKVFVDYNTEVKEGELLAELDKSLLLEDLNESKANFDKTTISLNYAKINLKRNKELFEKDYISRFDYEESEVSFAEAMANNKTAISRLKKSEKNLGYAGITSPISGVIISKEVERGQTVAASYQTPTLFKVAEDLTKMQIEASISEADIGVILKGQDVEFSVDAYPSDTFLGKVSQIRLNPTTESNVVTYTVIIDIDNKNGILLPGMTAFVSVKITNRENAIRVPNMVFQYRPRAVKENLGIDQGFVYVLKDGKEERVLIKKGVSNSSYTEALAGVKEGDKLIYEVIGNTKTKKR